MNYIHTALALLVVTVIAASSCTQVRTHDQHVAAGGQDLTRYVRAADEALPDIEAPAIVYAGEAHDQYGHHLNQLAVIAALRERGLNVSIGMEMVQTPFQQPLDQYISGSLDFESMLDQTEYFDRWRYDPRLYAPIFEYSRKHELPVVALNAPKELTDRVSEVGIAGLDSGERSALPDTLTPLAPEYRALLEAVFEEHVEHDGDADLDRFIDVQSTWDEVMGARSAAYLEAHPDRVLVVLAGYQHVAHGHGIPARVETALDLPGTIVLTGNAGDRTPDGGDVYLETPDENLPDNGRLGVYISNTETGAMIMGFVDDSAAQSAGAREGDVIVMINRRDVEDFGDVKLELWDQLPGDTVRLVVQRGPEGTVTEFPVELK